MAKRTRTRVRPKPPPTRDPVQEQVENLAEELLTLWRLLPAALASDSAGLLTGDRHPTGGAKGSAAPANLEVIKAAVRVEKGITAIAAEAIPILNLDRASVRTTAAIIAKLPDWHRSLAGRRQPLAEHLAKDLKSWVYQARGAIGTRKPDRQLGGLCPDHRDVPTGLLEEGAEAQVSASLLAGPPPGENVLVGPRCQQECVHQTCETIRDRRLMDKAGRPSDWILVGGQPAWLSMRGEQALRWTESGAVRCPKCKRRWATLGERRMLAREIAAAGDGRPSSAESMVK